MKLITIPIILSMSLLLASCNVETQISTNDSQDSNQNENTVDENNDEENEIIPSIPNDENDETEEIDDSTDNVHIPTIPNDDNVSSVDPEDIAQGAQLYDLYCVGCHLEDGSGPTGANLIDCNTCDDHGLLTFRIDDTMPPSNPESLNLVESSLIADYIMATFAIQSNNDMSTQLSEVVSNTLTPKESAYKIAFDVAGSTPSEQELNTFLSADEQIIDQWLDSEYFYKRLMSFYNKKLKTDSFHSRFERESNYDSARSLIAYCPRGTGGGCNNTSDDRELYFPNHMWWDDLPFEGVIADMTNDAIAREPLEFIRYVAKNDLPFSEILTADYALVNAYSAKSLNAQNLDGSFITSEDFNNIPAPTISESVNGEAVESLYLAPMKTLMRDLNRNRGSDVQLNIGNDENLTSFLNLYPEDPTHFIPAIYEQSDLNVPLAGILTTKAFLNKFTTTPTNKQRTRANMVFNIFAATDILAIEANRDASLVDFSDSLGSVDPTKTNEDCLVCHRKLDPVASAFKNWMYQGIYKNSTCQDSASINTCATNPSVGIGFENTAAPIFGSNSVDANALQWLAKTIAQDPLFAKSVVETVFTGFTGKEVLALNQSKDNAYQLQYEAQQSLLNAMTQTFNDSNENIKETVKVLLTSDYYLAKQVVDTQNLDKIGSDRILGADQLQNKFYATTKHISSTTEVDDSFKLNLGNRATWKMYGGVDGLNTHDLPNEQGGIMLTIQERLANEMACFVTAQDLHRDQDERLFMKELTYQMTKGNVAANSYILNELEAKKTIAYMHLHFWHQEVGINSKEVNEVYNLLVDVLQTGRQLREEGEVSRDVKSFCRVDYNPDTNVLLAGDERSYRDDEFTVRAWSVITAYFLGDFKFSHI